MDQPAAATVLVAGTDAAERERMGGVAARQGFSPRPCPEPGQLGRPADRPALILVDAGRDGAAWLTALADLARADARYFQGRGFVILAPPLDAESPTVGLDYALFLPAGCPDWHLARALGQAWRHRGAWPCPEVTSLVQQMGEAVALHEAIRSPDGKLADYRFIAANAAFGRQTGLPVESLPGRTVRELLPGIEESWFGAYQAVLDDGTARRFDDFSRDLNRHYAVEAYRVGNERFAVVVEDVSAARQEEERLRQEREVFERLLAMSPVGIMVLDRDGRFTFSNPQADAVLGIVAGAAIGRSYDEPAWGLAAPDLRPLTPDEYAFAQVRASASPVIGIQHSLRRADGQRVLVSISAAPLLDAHGEFDGMIIALSDVTARHQAESILRSSEDRFRNLADNGMALIWSAGAERDCNFFNKPWLDFTGQPLSGLLGKGWLDGVHPDDREHCLSTYRQAWGERARFSMDYRLKRWDGVYRWVQDDGAPCFDSNGDFTGYIGHCLDITDHKLAISRINLLLAEKDLLLREVHHRIKNNMASIMGLLSLQAQTIENPEVVSALDAAVNRIRSMSLLYDKLYRTPEFRQISLREYLPSLVQEIRSTFPRYPRVKISVQIENTLLNVNTVVPLGIMINELITNSMKYAFAGRSEGHIELKTSCGDGRLTIELSDDGPGLPAGLQPGEGSGFGLQLCQQLAQEVGGTFECLPPPGARFVLDLPLY